MSYQVSIIVPVYNAQKYLTKCLDSLVNQSLKDIQIILINDGSTDSSIQIMKTYEKKYSNIIIYTTENKGVSHARNMGVGKSSGKYILFVDSDDFIAENMCETLYHKAEADQNDLVLCGRYDYYEAGQTAKENIVLRPCNIKEQNFALIDVKENYIKISPFPWDKLYSRSLIEQMPFPDGIRFEDLAVSYFVVAKAKNIGVVEKPLYYYRRTTEGGFLNRISEGTLDITKAFVILMDKLKIEKLDSSFHTEIEYLCIRHFCTRYQSFFQPGNEGHFKLKKRIIKETYDFLETKFPEFTKNPYLKTAEDPNIQRHWRWYTKKEKLMLYLFLRMLVPVKLICKWHARFTRS